MSIPAAVSRMPAVAELVSHRRAMLLLDAVNVLEEDFILTSLTVRADGRFDAGGRVPAWVGIEYMAQAMSALNGHRMRLRGKPVRLGFLAGTRRFNTHVSHFRCGDLLQVSARRLMQTEEGLGSFDCLITRGGDHRDVGPGGEILCEARISAYAPEDPETYYALAQAPLHAEGGVDTGVDAAAAGSADQGAA